MITTHPNNRIDVTSAIIWPTETGATLANLAMRCHLPSLDYSLQAADRNLLEGNLKAV
jgi:hypothetical protein